MPHEKITRKPAHGFMLHAAELVFNDSDEVAATVRGQAAPDVATLTEGETG